MRLNVNTVIDCLFTKPKLAYSSNQRARYFARVQISLLRHFRLVVLSWSKDSGITICANGSNGPACSLSLETWVWNKWFSFHIHVYTIHTIRTNGINLSSSSLRWGRMSFTGLFFMSFPMTDPLLPCDIRHTISREQLSAMGRNLYSKKVESWSVLCHSSLMTSNPAILRASSRYVASSWPPNLCTVV